MDIAKVLNHIKFMSSNAPCADVNSPYKRKCWTNSGVHLGYSFIWAVLLFRALNLLIRHYNCIPLCQVPSTGSSDEQPWIRSSLAVSPWLSDESREKVLCVVEARTRGSQRDVCLCWPIAPSYTSPIQMRGDGGVAGSQPMSTAVHITWHGAQINFGDLPPINL